MNSSESECRRSQLANETLKINSFTFPLGKNIDNKTIRCLSVVLKITMTFAANFIAIQSRLLNTSINF